MRNSPTLSVLIGGIYDATLLPDLWPQVLADICLYVGGEAAMLFLHDSVFLEGCRLTSWGDDPHYTDLYFSRYIDLSPTAKMQGDVPDGVATAVSKLISPDILFKSQFFREWMEPQGYVDNVFANLYRTATRSAALAVSRGRSNGMVDALALRRMQTLVPHVQRAVLIGNLLESQRSSVGVLKKLIDGLTARVFLTKLDGAIVQTMGAEGRREPYNELVWCGASGNLQMDRRLAAEVVGFSRLAAASDEPQGMRRNVPLSDGNGNGWLVQLLWLGNPRPSSLKSLSDEPVAAFCIKPVEFDARIGVEMISRRFCLTPRETDILRSMVKGTGLRDVAEREGISTRTAKAHLYSVFAKTGTKRQVDLVKLVASFVGPY